MGLSLGDKMMEVMITTFWEGLKDAVKDGGREVLKDPWPIVRALRFGAAKLEEYALAKGIPDKEKS
jgi:hypothetical protein